MLALPPHRSLTFEHDSHKLAMKTAAEGVAGYHPHFWVNAAEIERALEADSVWMARLVTPKVDSVVIRVASDLEVLIASLRSR